MAIKVYQDLIEAFDDLNWNGKGERADFKVSPNVRLRDAREKRVREFFEQEFVLWMKQARLDQSHGERYTQSISQILWELVKNAEYETGCKQSFTAELYIGESGSLMGTRQSSRFLKDEEIGLLNAGQCPVSDTESKEPKRDFKMLFDEGNGLLVIKKQKLIYVAKYYPQPRNR